MKLRKWLKILHRDIGYLAVGLTILFSISGIAVNHIHEWNPNYSIEIKESEIPVPQDISKERLVDYVLNALQIDREPNGWHRTSPQTLQIFLEGNTIDFNLETGLVRQEIVDERAVLRQFNILHLNEPKQAWTWFSDFYALNLMFLAISGIFLIKGKKGWKWRGTWLVTVGILIPILFLWYYR